MSYNLDAIFLLNTFSNPEFNLKALTFVLTITITYTFFNIILVIREYQLCGAGYTTKI